MKIFRKIICVIFTIILLSNTVGCAFKEDSVDVDLFISKDAENLVYDYFDNIKHGNIEEALKLCSKEFVNKNKGIVVGNESVITFMKDEIREGRNTGYVMLNVVRGVKGKDISDLDKITAIVIKENGEYKINDIKTQTIREIYVSNNEIRIIGEEGGISNLVLRLSDIPKEVYSKNNTLMVYKEKTPIGSFSNIDLGYLGDKIALSTKEGNRNYLAIIRVGEINSKNTSTEMRESGFQGELDNPIAQKITTLDILNDVSMDKFTFTKDDKEIIVSYIKNGVKRVNIYDSDTGELVQLKFDDIFPANKYNVEVDKVREDEITIKVSNFKDANKALLGYYKINTQQVGIEKI